MSDAIPVLRFGPYHPPRVQVGDEIVCELYGLSIVADWTDAPISWPRRKPERRAGRRTIILCGDLIRALRIESAPAIAAHWGISKPAIVRWRRMLDITEYPDGARAQLRENLGIRRERLPEMLHKGTGAKSNPRKDAWHPDEDHIVLTRVPKEAAELTGRTLTAVYLRGERLRRKARYG